MYFEDILKALDWQGGTIRQVLDEIKRLRRVEIESKSAILAAWELIDHPDVWWPISDETEELLEEAINLKIKILGDKNA